MGRSRRWAAVVGGIAVLVTLPVLISHRPLHAKPRSAAQLLATVRESGAVPYSGLVQAEGDLSLPNLPASGDLAGLLSGTTRLRVWRSSDQRLRVDQLADDGETDTVVDGASAIQWDSTREEVTQTTGAEPLRVPDAGDLLPPALAKRLTPDGLQAIATRLPARRLAGRTALGLRLTPTAATTTVRFVDIEVDQDSGLPLGIAVTARGRGSPSFSAAFLQVHIGQPPAKDLEFVAPVGSIIRHTQAPDFVADANRYAPFLLPDSLAGLSRTDRVTTLNGNSGAATYGSGYTLMALLPIQQSTARQVLHALEPPTGVAVITNQPGAEAVEEQLPLANVLAVDGGGRAYLLAGTVTPRLLIAAANALLASPPPFRPRFQQGRGPGGAPR